MERQKHIIKINLPGGIVSPGDLYEILDIAADCGVEKVRFGNRQQLLFYVSEDEMENLSDKFLVNDVIYETNLDDYPNIVSSYVTEDIFPNYRWLTEGVYKDILNDFHHRPKLKINIVDYYQNLIPFFTGNLNFIASEISNFWYLYIRFPKTNTMFCWPSLIYSEDIADISALLEEKMGNSSEAHQWADESTGKALYTEVNALGKFVHQDFEHPLIHTDFQLPYYEGLNRYSDKKSWLGIYRRLEEYDISFLKEVCEICFETRNNQLYTTAWKSLVIKEIDNQHRAHWSNLLNKFRINIRHAANELNWQTEDLCEEALRLKIDLVRKFEDLDLRTYRLCFAIKTKPRTGLFSAIVIRKRSSKNEVGDDLYELLYTKDFNPNCKEYIHFHERLTYENLAPALTEICDLYYSLRVNNHTSPVIKTRQHTHPNPSEDHFVYQCEHCQSIYDERLGDAFSDIPENTSFDDLENYRCPICESGKEDFKKLRFPLFSA